MKVFQLIILLFAAQLFAQKAELVIPKGASYRVSKDGHIVELDKSRKIVTIYEPITFRKQSEFVFKKGVTIDIVNDDASSIQFKENKIFTDQVKDVYFTLKNGSIIEEKIFESDSVDDVKMDKETEVNFRNLLKEVKLSDKTLVGSYHFKDKVIHVYSKEMENKMNTSLVVVTDLKTKKSDFFEIALDNLLEKIVVHEVKSETITYFSRSVYAYNSKEREKQNIIKNNGVETKLSTFNYKGQLIRELYFDNKYDDLNYKNLDFMADANYNYNLYTYSNTKAFPTLYNYDMILNHKNNYYSISNLDNVNNKDKYRYKTQLLVTKFDEKGNKIWSKLTPCINKTKKYHMEKRPLIVVDFIQDQLLVTVQHGNGLNNISVNLETGGISESFEVISKYGEYFRSFNLKGISEKLFINFDVLQYFNVIPELKNFINEINLKNKNYLFISRYKNDSFYIDITELDGDTKLIQL